MNEEHGIEDVYTSIRISKRNRRRLYEFGKMGDTLNDVLDEVLDFYEQHH